MSINWAIPTQVNSTDTNILTEDQIKSWREKGFAVVDGLLSDELIKAVYEESFEELKEAPDRANFGSGGTFEYPTGRVACDEVTLHPRLLQAASELLNVKVKDLRLALSDIWIKRGVEEDPKSPVHNNSQRIHCDFGNQYLTHPPSWDNPESVSMIVYYSDVEDCSGSTGLAPREGPDDPSYKWPLTHMPGLAGLPWMNDRNIAEEWFKNNRPDFYELRKKLYEREMQVKFRPGTVLLYRQDVFHRGTPLKPNKYRVVQNLVYRKKEAEWIPSWNKGFTKALYGWNKFNRFFAEEIIAKSSVDQRCVLGFPEPGHSYWNPVTIEAVAARYSMFGFDKTPYEEALNKVEN